MNISTKNYFNYFDIKTLEYDFAFKNKINVKWVFTFLKDQENKERKSLVVPYYEREILDFNDKISHVNLTKIIVILGKEKRNIKYIRSYLREHYKPLNTNDIAIVYEHYFPNELHKPLLLKGLKYRYSPVDLQKKYKLMILNIETYPEIINKADKLLYTIFNNQKIITSTPIISNQKKTIKFISKITSEQFFSLITCSEQIQLISMGNKYKVWSNISFDTYKRYYTSVEEKKEVLLLVSLITTKQNVLTLLNINYDNKTISLKDVGAIELNKQLSKILIGIDNLRVLETKDFIGSFNLYGVNYSPEIMSYSVMNIYPINQVLYIDEKDDPSTIRGKDSVYHVNSLGQFYDSLVYSEFIKNESIIRFSLKIKSHTSKSKYLTPSNNTLVELKPPKTSYLKVSFNHASSMKSVYLLRIYLSNLFSIYNKKRRTVVSLYRKLGFLVGKVELKESIKEKRITLLTNVFEDVYNVRPQGYSSSCELYRQPKIINKDEYDLIKDQDHRYTILTNNLGKKYYLYCDKDDKPDIHIPEGGYPCCFSSGEIPKKTKDKILSPGIITELPPVINLWISFFVKGDYYRMGPSIGGDDSFYSCIIDSIVDSVNNYTIEKLKLEILDSLKSRNWILDNYSEEDLLSALDRKIDSSIL